MPLTIPSAMHLLTCCCASMQIYQDEIGMVRGHFGPINAVAFHPDGRSFVTGGEDGYVRLQHFDQSYFNVLHKEA